MGKEQTTGPAVQRMNDIPYAPEHGFRGLGDLFLPENPHHAPTALVIHGGGWNAMEKKSLTPVAALMAACGYAAFNVNYRLLDDAPWPACGEDCVRAGEFLLRTGHHAFRGLDVSRVVVLGASAGGHLALWTGLHLPQERVRAIISIAGPADLVRRWHNREKDANVWRTFLGGEVTEEKLEAASPIAAVRAGAPRLLCIHSINDTLVQPEQSRRMAEAYARVGAQAELFTFDGPGVFHGIWEDGSGEVETDQRILVPEVRDAVRSFLKRLS